LAWSEITDLDKKKRGVAIALTLPKDDESKIREKVLELACFHNSFLLKPIVFPPL
jgi:hypothetical protein